MPNKVIAISSEVANAVRQSPAVLVKVSPRTKEPAGDGLPCCHCLRVITPQKEQAILFTYNRFDRRRKPAPSPAPSTSTRTTANATTKTPASRKNFAEAPEPSKPIPAAAT